MNFKNNILPLGRTRTDFEQYLTIRKEEDTFCGPKIQEITTWVGGRGGKHPVLAPIVTQ